MRGWRHQTGAMLVGGAVAVSVVLGVAVAPARAHGATSGRITLPDLQIEVPTADISIGTNPSTGDRQLQFTHVTWDAGPGPFVIQPRYDGVTGLSSFVQDIFRMPRAGVWRLDHTVPIAVAGTFVAPSDYRFPLTRFTLNAANPDGSPGRVVAVSPKTDYCITADTFVGGVPNTPSQTSPPQGDCTNRDAALGFSVGWGDQYDQTDNGQPIDLTGIPDGTYVLHATADPQHVFTEADVANDVVDTELRITGSSLTVLDQVARTTHPPTVRVTGPPPGASVRGTVTLSASAVASAPATVASVRYLLDGTPIGPALTVPPYRFRWGVASTPLGAHVLSAQVTDSNGNVGTARPVHVNVRPSSLKGLSIDTSVTSDGHGALTTPPLSTSRTRDVLVAFAAIDGPSSPSSQATRVSGAGLRWHLVTRANATPGDAEVWSATASAHLKKVRITSTPAAGGYAQQLTVIALAGAGSVGGTARASAPSGAPSVSLTARSAGSMTFAVGSDWDHDVARTVAADQSLLYQWLDVADGDTFWVQGSTAKTGATGVRVTLSDTAPQNDEWNMTGVEVRPLAAPAPQVTIVNPAPNEDLSGTTHLAAVLGDPDAVRSMRFSVDGDQVSAATSHAPFADRRWDTRTVKNGRHLVTVTATDALGRTVRASTVVVVSNPAPVMTCFVLEAVVHAHGAGTVMAPPLHAAAQGERLVAFVQGHRLAGRATVVGGGLAWRRVRTISTTNGTLAIWSAIVRRVVPVVRISSLGEGLRSLTVIAIEGTRGPGATAAAMGHGPARAELLTTRPTSLIFSMGVVDGTGGPVPAGWAPISRWTDTARDWSTWVWYTNQPTQRARTLVAVPTPRSPRRWVLLAVELPGSGD